MEVKTASRAISGAAAVIHIDSHKNTTAAQENKTRMSMPLPITTGALLPSLDISLTSIGRINRLSVELIKKKKTARKDIFPNPAWLKYLAKEMSNIRLRIFSPIYPAMITPLLPAIFRAVDILSRPFKTPEFSYKIPAETPLNENQQPQVIVDSVPEAIIKT